MAMKKKTTNKQRKLMKETTKSYVTPEPAGSSPYKQPTIGLYPEPAGSTLHPPNQSP
jgi:hypothetical protein